MKDFFNSSRVKELQAMLFPVQPIPGGAISNLERLQDLQLLQLGRYEDPRRETDLSLFSVPFGAKDEQSEETLRSVLITRCMIDGVTQEAARWPTECQVLPERVRHIDYAPAAAEPFYEPTGREPKPKPLSDELGTVVFRYHPTSITNYFSRSCVGGSSILPFTTEQSNGNESTDAEGNNGVLLVTRSVETTEDSNTDLRFESCFESGNLSKVVKITDTYYQLYLRKDLYTQRHTQWYYFRISNTRSRTTYRLSIVNLCKEESLYNEGLRPLLYSTEDAKKRAVGWRRCGDNIAYYRNDSSSDEEKEKHTLTFNVSFPHDRDTVYLAHCYPYTYSDLQEYLAKLVEDPVKTRFTKLRLLCRTLAGNGVYYLTITAPTYEEDAPRKRGIVITARVHPGETPSSWTMKGIIDFLTGESDQARTLREKFVFKLVPMLNPDGVIVGNNRCSLSGKDLNRQYRTVMRESYPSVWHTKLMIRRLLEECGVAVYCDLHAHSRKHNIFVYGCEGKRTGPHARLSEQVFPLMLHKNAADKFSFENCKFHVEKGKEGTGRVVVWSMGVQNSYTMEASMGGSKIGSRSGTHFSTQDYEQIGRVFCETLLDFFDQDPIKTSMKNVQIEDFCLVVFVKLETKERLRNKIIARLMKEGSSAEEPTNIDLTDYSSDDGDTSSSSASEKEETELAEDTWPSALREATCSPRYLCAPPPTPTFVPPRSLELARRRAKKGGTTAGNYFQRKRILARRTVMDLPTTDPGCDFCDFTDSADESYVKREGSSARAHEQYKEEETIRLMDREIELNEKEGLNDDLVLPEIARPRSVSLGESLNRKKEEGRSNGPPQCLHLLRTFERRSQMPLKYEDIRIKLSSLRQQIWMGIPLNVDDKAEEKLNSREPLSWGVTNTAKGGMNSDLLLKSRGKKLQYLEYPDSNAKNRMKRNESHCARESSPEIEVRQKEGGRKSRKKSRLKWQKIVNLNSRVKESCQGRTSFLIKADSLKIVTVELPSKPPRRQEKSESKRSYRKSESTCVAAAVRKASNVSKCRVETNSKSHVQLQPLIVPLLDSLSSDDDSSKSRRRRKKKQKKKKQPKKTKSATGRKKRASSAKLVN